MYRPVLAVFAVLLFSNSALAQAAPPAPASATPPSRSATDHAPGIQAGTYDIELAFGGGTMAGTLVIKTVGDSLDAKLLVGEHSPPINSITRKGSQLTLAGKGEGIDVRYDLQFSGDALIGKFTFNGDGGGVTGKRRK